MAKARPIPGLSEEDVYAAAAARVVAVRASELAQHAGGVLDMRQIERLHDMRVATRRLRAALEVFEPCFPRKRWRRALRAVKSLADALGERRDRDVSIAALREFADGIGEEDRPGVESLIERLGEEQEDANEALAPSVSADAVEELCERLETLVAVAAVRGGIPAPPVTRVAGPQAVPEAPSDPASARRAPRDRRPPAGGQDEGGAGAKARPAGAAGRQRGAAWSGSASTRCAASPPAALHRGRAAEQHDLRIAAKRLRYVLEATGFCFGTPADRARRGARELQSVLGDLHDCDVMRPRVSEQVDRLRGEDAAAVRELAGDADDLDPALAARAPHRTAYRGLELLTVHVEARRALLFDRFLETWSRLDDDGVWDELERAIATKLELTAARRAAAERAREAADELADAERAEREAANRSRRAAEELLEARRAQSTADQD